jgi:hypothetical protein
VAVPPAEPDNSERVLEDIRATLRQLVADLRALLIAYLVLSGPGR